MFTLGLPHVLGRCSVFLTLSSHKYVPPENLSDPLYEHLGEEVLQEIKDKRNGNQKQKAEAAEAAEMESAMENAVETGLIQLWINLILQIATSGIV